MQELEHDRDTPRRDGMTATYPVATEVKIYIGSMVLPKTSSGTPGVANVGMAGSSSGAFVLGVATNRADTTADGPNAGVPQFVTVDRRAALMENSNGGEAVTYAELGKQVYAAGDCKVSKSNSGGRAVAGRVLDVTPEGVWVRFE